MKNIIKINEGTFNNIVWGEQDYIYTRALFDRTQPIHLFVNNKEVATFICKDVTTIMRGDTILNIENTDKLTKRVIRLATDRDDGFLLHISNLEVL